VNDISRPPQDRHGPDPELCAPEGDLATVDFELEPTTPVISARPDAEVREGSPFPWSRRIETMTSVGLSKADRAERGAR